MKNKIVLIIGLFIMVFMFGCLGGGNQAPAQQHNTAAIDNGEENNGGNSGENGGIGETIQNAINDVSTATCAQVITSKTPAKCHWKVKPAGSSETMNMDIYVSRTGALRYVFDGTSSSSMGAYTCGEGNNYVMLVKDKNTYMGCENGVVVEYELTKEAI